MAIQFYLTDVGRTAALNADNLGLDLQIKYIAVGDASSGGLYNAAIEAATMTALDNELERYLVNGGEIEPTTHTLRFTVNLNSSITADIYEIGLFDENNVLFAVASSTTTPLVQLINEVITIITFGFSLDDVDNITLMLDVNSPLAVTLMNQHTAHAHPHAQYKRIHNDTEICKVANGVAPKDAVNKEQLDAEALVRSSTDTLLQNSKAALNGDNTQRFKVANALFDNEAVNRLDLSNALSSTLGTLNLANKADLNGNITQVFNVANATSDNHAVPKTQMEQAINTSRITDLHIINLMYPVGIVVEFNANVNPNGMWPGTIWDRFAEGQTTVGYNSGDPDFGTIGGAGGAKGHVMTNINMPLHSHDYNRTPVSGTGFFASGGVARFFVSEEVPTPTSSVGQATPAPIPTLPPYIVVSKWVRTA